MTPIDQTQFVDRDGKGNCVQAAIASMLDKPLDAVPAFRDLPADQFDSAFDTFLQANGWRRIAVKFATGFEWGDAFFDDGIWHPLAKCHISGPPVLIFGGSPRGNYGHAVVGRINGANWRVVHDPHPSRAGIAGNPKSIHWIVPLG